MQKQYKLYKLDKDGMEYTLSKLKEYNIVRLSKQFVAIEYEYDNKSHRELMEFMSDKPATQYLFMAGTYYKILSYLVDGEYRVYDIKLNSVFVSENEILQSYINKLETKDKNKILDKLLDELHWYNYDEGIDIVSMSFGVKREGIYYRTHLYNNGIIAIDDDRVSEQIFSIIDKMI